MKRILSLSLIFILLFCFTGCAEFSDSFSTAPTASADFTDTDTELSGGMFRVVFIDVGQGDSILLTTPSGKNMLIDSGESDAYEAVSETLRAYGVTHLDWVLATHPHSDHIGCMYKILGDYSVGCCYLPDATHTTRTFEKMIEALETNEIPTVEAKAGVNIDLGDGILCKMYAPFGEEMDNLNNYSPIMRVTYGETAFLFSGDAEMDMEERVLSEDPDLHADVMKLGHHGSSTSNSEAFLNAVSPRYAVCSVGKDNSYGHPHEEVLSLLEKYQIPLLRTDESGNIVIYSDGMEISLAESDPSAQMPQSEDIVYKTKSGKAYHTDNCPSCKNSTLTEITRAEAEALGLHACPNCNP